MTTQKIFCSMSHAKSRASLNATNIYFLDPSSHKKLLKVPAVRACTRVFVIIGRNENPV